MVERSRNPRPPASRPPRRAPRSVWVATLLVLFLGLPVVYTLLRYGCLRYVKLTYERGAYASAVMPYRLATWLAPSDLFAHFMLANALGFSKDVDGGIVELHRTIALDPAYPFAHTSLGNALLFRHRDDEADAEFRQAVRDDRRDYRAHLLLGMSLQERGRKPEALPEIQQALALKPEDRYTRWQLERTLHPDTTPAGVRRDYPLPGE